MLEANGFVLPGYTQGQHQLVGSPFDASRNAGWQDALGPRQVSLFEAVAGDLMDLLGYGRATPGAPPPPSGRDRLESALTAAWRAGVNRRRYRRRIKSARQASSETP